MFDKRLVKNFDFILLLVVLMLVAIGIFGIGAAQRQPTEGVSSIMDAVKALIFAMLNCSCFGWALAWFLCL